MESASVAFTPAPAAQPILVAELGFGAGAGVDIHPTFCVGCGTAFSSYSAFCTACGMPAAGGAAGDIYLQEEEEEEEVCA